MLSAEGARGDGGGLLGLAVPWAAHTWHIRLAAAAPRYPPGAFHFFLASKYFASVPQEQIRMDEQ